MRSEIRNTLLTLTPNVFQDYPNKEEDYPCLVFGVSYTATTTHDGLGYFDVSLRVEIYASTSEERSELEMKVITTLVNQGWINDSNTELPHPDYYRQNLMFSTIK